MPTYDVTVTTGFRIEAATPAIAKDYARMIQQSLNEASCTSISGGNGNAIRTVAPKISVPKLSNKPMPKHYARVYR